jgi:hypothetical protein
MSSSNAKQDPLKSTHVVKVSDSVRIIDEESPKEGLALVWYYVVFVFNKLIALFKAIAQVLVILYQFLCLLYQYPTCMGYAVEITVNSLLTCYRTGIWVCLGRKTAYYMLILGSVREKANCGRQTSWK